MTKNRVKKVFDVQIDITECLDSYALGELNYKRIQSPVIRVYSFDASDAVKFVFVKCILEYSSISDGDVIIDVNANEYLDLLNQYDKLKYSTFCNDNEITISCYFNEDDELVYTNSNEYDKWKTDETQTLTRCEFELFSVTELVSIDLKEIKL